MVSLAWSSHEEDLVASYAADLAAAGMGTGSETLGPARAFFDLVGQRQDWALLPLNEQLAVPLPTRRFVTWMMATPRLAASAGYLMTARPHLAAIARREDPGLAARFETTAAALGFSVKDIQAQWSALTKVGALRCVAPGDLTGADIRAGRDSLVAAYLAVSPAGHGAKALSRALFGAQATMFHAGVIDERPGKAAKNHRPATTNQAAPPPQMAATIANYIDQIATTHRPSTVTHAASELRQFGSFIARSHPDVTAVSLIRRRHIEAYKLWLAERPARTETGRLSRAVVVKHLSSLRAFFERLAEWGSADAPVGVLVFSGDFPILDRPLPRFLDDGAAAKLAVAARTDPDPFVRLCVEFLARTGMRKGEFLDLTVDAVVQIGSAFWLRVPVGKLHNDRYIPLHPHLKTLIDDWLADRPDGLRSKYLFVEKGRRVTASRVDRAVSKAATTAGIGHVHPHQLRHTLATQAINRGMSLEAIAALLGHRSMTMTMVYARIADRTVADEYFAVSDQVEALYDRAAGLPATAEGAEMLKLRREMHQRMLGNGYCARPVELDCHFESICESCTFFVTTIEFKPTLQRQRDDAANKGQIGRQKIFDGLLSRLPEQAS
jgi:integrase